VNAIAPTTIHVVLRLVGFTNKTPRHLVAAARNREIALGEKRYSKLTAPAADLLFNQASN
jgi:hypothetical protein